jgi:hypothetical protein
MSVRAMCSPTALREYPETAEALMGAAQPNAGEAAQQRTAAGGAAGAPPAVAAGPSRAELLTLAGLVLRGVLPEADKGGARGPVCPCLGCPGTAACRTIQRSSISPPRHASSPGDSDSDAVASPAAVAALEAAVRRQYGMEGVAALGHGAPQRLLADAASASREGAAAPPAVLLEAALVATALSDGRHAGGQEDAPAASLFRGAWRKGAPDDLEAAAWAVLASLPALCELRQASQWDRVFAEKLGPLRPFLDRCVPRWAGWRIVEARGGCAVGAR